MFFGALTLILSVLLAGVFMVREGGLTLELLGFALWSLPLALVVTKFAQRRRFESARPSWRAPLSASAGAILGAMCAVGGQLISGGAILAFGVPVLYCWTIAGAGGAWAVAACGREKPIGILPTLASALIVIIPLASLARNSRSMMPAIRVTFSRDSSGDAATYAWDSLLTTGRGGRRVPAWPIVLWRRWDTSDSTTEVLLVPERASDVDSIRRALGGYVHTAKVSDTLVKP